MASKVDYSLSMVFATESGLTKCITISGVDNVATTKAKVEALGATLIANSEIFDFSTATVDYGKLTELLSAKLVKTDKVLTVEAAE